MREVITNVVVRCDFCGEKHSDMHPIETKVYAWDGQDREIDLCPSDLKEVGTMFEALAEKSRRPEGARRRSGRPRKQPYSGDTRFNQWYNEGSAMFRCPGVHTDGRACTREFTTANGLAVHHSRQHGAKL